ncbi:MAG: transglutaminase-like domain-containing protein, partial [Xanthomonadales bacterium]|nr:transglutaminase-like domain-containing protein [Xanthomonadales bacterium]
EGRWDVTIGGKRVQREPTPTASDTAANAWLQSDAPGIRALAKRAVGTATSDSQRMQHLQRFVSHYIRHKNLSVGYASALEVLHSREGDCTEHAVLLGALARALNIPTRIVGGLVYMPHFAGKQAALVPHAWVQSWVDGHWRSYDAALGGFDSGHVALAFGNGAPWQFFAGMRTLGRLQVVSVTPSQTARDPKTDAATAR